jgi:hypothetical protein
LGAHETVRCPACGHDRPAEAFGLGTGSEFDPNIAQPNELAVRRKHFGGRARITHEVMPAPLPLALGMRQMLKYRLAQVEADIRAAGVELPDDE